MAMELESILRIISYATYCVGVGFLVLHLFARPRDARAVLLWLAVILGIPFVGPLVYVLFGINTTPSKSWKKQASDAAFAEADVKGGGSQQIPADADDALQRVIDRLTPDFPLRDGNAVRLIEPAAAALDAMVAAIDGATSSVNLASYIIGDDAAGRRVLDACAAAARRGVSVRVLYDGFGSASAAFRGLFRRYRRVTGLQVRVFSQANVFRRRFQLHLRSHRKILVIDGIRAFTGGVNFSAVYLPSGGRAPTIDFHFEVRGPVVRDLQYAFLRDWYYMTDETAESLLSARFFPVLVPVGPASARLVNSGPTADEEANALALFFAAVGAARTQILVVTPYFVPPSSLRLALRTAAARGVDVRILVPAVNNHPLIRLASRARYRELLLAGVRIFERRAPFIHAKALVVDDRIAVIGSANLDPRSLFLNYETNLVVDDPVFATDLKIALLEQFQNSDEIAYEVWRRRPFLHRLAENVANLFSPVA